jgi:hypothetical protein
MSNAGEFSRDDARAIVAAGAERRAAEKRPERRFYWRWPVDGQAWIAWAFQNYGSRWIVWRVGPLNYRIEVAAPGQSGGWIGRAPRVRR